MSKKNILIVSPPLKLIGGTEKQVKEVAKNLASKGHFVKISQKRFVFSNKYDVVHFWRADALLSLIYMKIRGVKTVYMLRDSIPFKYQKLRYLLILVATFFADYILSNSINGIINYRLYNNNNIRIILNEEHINDR